MKQMNVLRKLTLHTLTISLAALMTAGPALGQHAVRPSMRMEIPYPFLLGSTLMEPGTYTFAESKNGLTVQPGEHAPLMQVPLARIADSPDFLRDGTIVFEKTGRGRELAEIWIPGTQGFLLRPVASGDARDVVLANFLPQTSSVSGKSAFEQTCARCHGVDGHGNPQADKFFRMAIPHLASPPIQGMTDTALRAQINYGNKAMPPVETDEGGFRHRLPPQDVDAVIAYVRTLKQ